MTDNHAEKHTEDYHRQVRKENGIDSYGEDSQNKKYDEILKDLEESRKSKTNLEEKLLVERQLFKESLREDRRTPEKS